MCDSLEKGVGDKGSTRRGRVKNCYARNAMICELSIVTKHSHDKPKPSCLQTLEETITCNRHLPSVYVGKLVGGQQLS